MEQAELRERLLSLLEPIVEDHGAEVVDLELGGTVNNAVVRLLIHRESGVSVDLCADVSREAGDLLDMEDPMPGQYRLEVTSPGTGRPLKTDRDLARAAGRRLKVVMTTGRTVFGRLESWTDNALALLEGDERQLVERCQIAKATIEAQLN